MVFTINVNVIIIITAISNFIIISNVIIIIIMSTPIITISTIMLNGTITIEDFVADED